MFTRWVFPSLIISLKSSIPLWRVLQIQVDLGHWYTVTQEAFRHEKWVWFQPDTKHLSLWRCSSPGCWKLLMKHGLVYRDCLALGNHFTGWYLQYAGSPSAGGKRHMHVHTKQANDVVRVKIKLHSPPGTIWCTLLFRLYLLSAASSWSESSTAKAFHWYQKAQNILCRSNGDFVGRPRNQCSE